MIAGLETITGGRVQIGGREVKDVESKNRDIARVFQSYALYPHLSVRDNIAFALTLRLLSHCVRPRSMRSPSASRKPPAFWS